jgi:hypothetical protein
MYVNAVLSSMGAWEQVAEQSDSPFRELQQALASIDGQLLDKHPGEAIGRIHQQLDRHLDANAWQIGTQVKLPGGKHTFYTLDFCKGTTGGKLVIGKQAFILSTLLAHFPLSIQIHGIELGVVILPMRSLKPRLPKGVADFEGTCEVLEELSPLLIRYPYLIIGFSEIETPLRVTELTSDLDQYLLTRTSYTLNEMLMRGEKPEYDFKRELPEKIERITKEVCAMANFARGGMLLFGVDDNGEVVGIPHESLDTAKLRITNSVRSLCEPIPSFEFQSFELADEPDRLILLCHVEELKRKPCMLHNRVYIRSGPSAQPADAEEIRRLILGSVQE